MTTTPKAFPQATPARGFYEVTCDDVRNMDETMRLIDVRENDEVVGALAKLDRAEHVPMGEVPQHAGNWGKEEPLVIICRSGGRSGRVAAWLNQQGYTNVVSMAGGMMDWHNS